MKLGVMGGTFDPVHNGHLVAAEEAWCRFELEEVVFVLSARPPHKTDEPHSSVSDRLNMIRMAVEGNQHLSVSSIEAEREGLSFTVDTLRELKKVYGGEVELFFVAGADAVMEILTWKDPEQLLAETEFIVATRPEYPLEKIEKALPAFDSLGRPSIERIHTMEIPELEISSTEIRMRAAQGRPFRYMVPEQVWKYVEEKGLYQER